MPGAKRRALKKLLSPITSPHAHPSSPPSDNQISHHQQSSFSSITSDPANYLTDGQLKQDLEVESSLDNGSNREGGYIPLDNGGGVVGQGDGVDGLAGRDGMPDIPPLRSGFAAGGNVPEEIAGSTAQSDGGGKKKSSKQRFAEREARKREALLNSAPPTDPAWTAQLEKERQEEIKVVSDACIALNRELYEISPDGHCMYSAIADQLVQLSLLPPNSDYTSTRKIASEYMMANPDDFLPFLPAVGGEDSVGATDDGIMSMKDFGVYCERVKGTGEWGGEPEIQALSKAFKLPIHVIQRGPPTVVSHGGMDDSFGGAMTPEQSALLGDKVLRITYHRRMYGLGEHYNSLRKIQENSIPASMLFM